RQPGLAEAEDHLRQRAVHRRDQLVAEGVGDGEERAAGAQVVVLGEGAVEVRELRGPTRPLDLGRARRRLLVEADVAAATRIEVGVGDAVALAQRPSQRVGLHVSAELRHAARHLVAEDPAVLRQPPAGPSARAGLEGSRPSSNVSCRERTASSAYLSSITQDTAISEVEIIWMLMPSLESAANMRAATPEWLRMPTPTMETLA